MDTQFTSQPRAAARPTKSQATHINRFLALRAYRVHTIAVYGIVNEIAARTTQMSDDDVEKVLEGLWRGTENLISRSKMGHQRLLLMHLEYRDNFRIGDLSSRISLETNNGKEGPQLRGPSDFHIDASPLAAAINTAGDKILRKRCKRDDRLRVEGIDISACDTLSFGS